ncbi:phosphatase domain-containing protein [Altererythrobacter sp. MF3-039]|uniref:phosphatase domain-containing protein n=1 Tax=Altererythrobacter sp. MF3-039 TaxID=3252901 RepID=UPI00390CD481
MDLIHGPPVRIQPYFGYRSTERLTISARALRAGNPRLERRGRLQAFRTMVSQFASREEPGLPVELELKCGKGSAHRHEGVTDKEGFVHFNVALAGDWQFPSYTRWETVTFHWRNRKGEMSVDGHVLAPGQAAPLGVISDIDDTIIETGITGGTRSLLRNWRRVLAQMPEERIAVPGVDAFYGAIGGGAVMAGDTGNAGESVAATHRPFFYVSSSPWNLFSYLVAYKRSRNLPLGPIHLRDWGLNRETFGSSSHGSHKTDAIQRILDFYPELRFAMIGDDTQGDLPAFAHIASANPGRIVAIFLRRAAGPFSPEEEEAEAILKREQVPLWMGEDYSTGKAFLASVGLEQDGEAAEIIEAVDKAHSDEDAGV